MVSALRPDSFRQHLHRGDRIRLEARQNFGWAGVILAGMSFVKKDEREKTRGEEKPESGILKVHCRRRNQTRVPKISTAPGMAPSRSHSARCN